MGARIVCKRVKAGGWGEGLTDLDDGLGVEARVEELEEGLDGSWDGAEGCEDGDQASELVRFEEVRNAGKWRDEDESAWRDSCG